MAMRLPAVDVVLVGVGWTGGILAKELSEAGYRVVGLEQGQMRRTVPGWQSPAMHDELRYDVQHEMMIDVSRQTLTFRNLVGQTALPMRQLGSFLPGTGLGGAGVHWNGQTWRFLPSDFRLRSHVTERYGAEMIPEDMTIQDWGVTYEELEPFYTHFEAVCGIAGTAGNLNGEIRPGGNPFEGPRSRPFPNPPMKMSYAGKLFSDAATDLGYHPFPVPSANVTQHYTNPYGAQLRPCMYCGFCERHGCEHFAKASAQITVLPFALANRNFELRTNAHVTRVLFDPQARRATGVIYVDGRGREIEQPAEMVILCAFAHHNVHLLLVSGIGRTYDPETGQGVVGKNYTYQTMSSVGVFFGEDVNINPFMGAGALGRAIDDFNGDNFDHAGLGFIGGGYIACYTTGASPILSHPVPPGTPRWGLEWKRAVARHYNHTTSLSVHGASTAHRGNYLDLDPTYVDAYGQPLLRMTFDFPRNDRLMSRYVTERAAEIARRMGGETSDVGWLTGHYSIVPYQTTHNTGGAIMGTDPRTSVVNQHLQSWNLHNLWVMGSSVFPQNPGYNPTSTVGALTYRAADRMITDYLRNPRPLVPT
jgi:gluconate 2-dehydrogenase alpha chain